jgi:hypothetical protein
MSKSILVIGGMGPQASSYVNELIVNRVRICNKSVTICHITAKVEPFYSSSPKLILSEASKVLLWLG